MEIDGMVRLRVDDDGDGIPECDRERMRRPFTRSDSSRSRDTGGFGLGLAISDRIAKRHGGLLRIDRAAIGGARVEMQWPISAR
ncbi:Sensor protein RstB [compost metagenome]